MAKKFTTRRSSSAVDAARARRRLINQLEWAGTAEALALAGVLDGCISAAPCRSAACPVCGLAPQPVHCVPPNQRINGQLYPFKFERVRRVTVWVTDYPTRPRYGDTKRRELCNTQAISLALVEHRLGFGRQLLTHEIDAIALGRHFEGLGWARDGP